VSASSWEHPGSSGRCRRPAATDGSLCDQRPGPRLAQSKQLATPKVPASSVAADLRDYLEAANISLPPPLAHEDDPLEVLRAVPALAPHHTKTVDRRLRVAELSAVEHAHPTPHAREAILACHDGGRHVAVVSNNSTVAVQTYLKAQDLTRHVDAIVGRADSDPRQMKPSPHALLQTLQLLQAAASTSAMVGDSTSDIEASHAAGLPCIGYANKPGKYHRLLSARADALVTSMGEITSRLRTQRPSVQPIPKACHPMS
jgi:beta-phosphoglucomutase-like phosphatase (HAD superfamily)